MATSLSCGFFATRSALLAINVFYMASSLFLVSLFLQVVSVVLVSMGAYAKSASMVTSVSVLGGIIAAGVLLFIVAALGIYGTRKHHQATLFFVSQSSLLLYLRHPVHGHSALRLPRPTQCGDCLSRSRLRGKSSRSDRRRLGEFEQGHEVGH